ncbi:MSC_0621 family F1-like ATPase epsilon subunit [Mycoplasmopsis synoviae]|nr:hypothetical protein [Mycoplasmopsis synoviae]AKB10935.1 hypothetical protein VY93_00845 [Mycoplasmopsis synoviae ATCC 25204]
MKDVIKVKFLSQNNVENYLDIVSLKINNGLRDNWSEFKNNSIGSYTKCFFQVTLPSLDVEYFILQNVFISYIDDKITIKYNDHLKAYESVKKMQEFIKNIQKTYKENNKEITYLTSLRDLNSSLVEQAKIDEINDRNFKLKAIINFSLVPKKEVSWK